jgi:hypothetical protein
MIGCVVISKIFNVLKNKQEFDLVRYIAALNNLPQQPRATKTPRTGRQ